MMPHRPTVLGMEVSPGTYNELRDVIQQHLVDGEGLLHVATANPEYVMWGKKDSDFAHTINHAGIVTVDGVGLALAIRLLHSDVQIERYTGVALTSDIAGISARTGAGVFLLGAAPGIADDAATALLSSNPKANFVGTWAEGSPRPEHDDESIQRIAASGAKIVLVAYGAPAQITWIARNADRLESAGVKVVAGIGGALDYLSGHTPYAPAFVRKIGLEWLYRLVREPWRWRRQIVLPHFALLVLGEFLRSKRTRGVE